LRPGPIFKTILEHLLEEVLDNPNLNDPVYLIPRAKELAESPSLLQKQPCPKLEEDTEEIDQF
ncbi:MAG: hypothetical protein RBU29_18055, partial [bacterium]|nr:hypothetical protein [bacterium]